jgi:hypothetical protein
MVTSQTASQRSPVAAVGRVDGRGVSREGREEREEREEQEEQEEQDKGSWMSWQTVESKELAGEAVPGAAHTVPCRFAVGQRVATCRVRRGR